MSRLSSLDYFKTIEEISEYALSSVRSVCDTQKTNIRDKTAPPDLLSRSDERICELEDKLFTDFLTPLERGDIAALVHALRRILSVSADIYITNKACQTSGTSKESAVCVCLAEQLNSDISLLKKIRKPQKNPSYRKFRMLLSEYTEQKCRNVLISQKAYSEHSALYQRLRGEITLAYDTLLEIMLNNI